MMMLPLAAVLLAAPPDTARVVLVATTDLHGYVTDWDFVENISWAGGLARAATEIDSLRAVFPDQVVVVDAGDVLQGNAFAAFFGRISPRRPNPIIDAMNQVGYAAAAPGDRDFDFGVERFQQALADATFPWVSANLRVVPADTLAYKPYVVVQRGPVRVAIGGWLTPAAMVAHRDLLRGRYRVDRIEKDAVRLVGEMRRDADLVVVLSHSGLAGPSSYDTTGVGEEQGAWRFSVGAARPDVVVLGHSHATIVDTTVGGVHFVQPPPYGRGLAVVEIRLVQRDNGWRPVSIRAQSLPLARVEPSARLLRRLLEPHGLVAGWASGAVGEARERLSAAAGRAEDNTLVRMIQEVQRQAVRAELSSTPVFDPRAVFLRGEITRGQLFRLYPEEYSVRAIRLSGADLKAYLEQSAWYFYADSTGRVATNRFFAGVNYDVVSGVDYTVDLRQGFGNRITRLEFRGRPVVPTDTFTMAITSYRQQGGGAYTAIAEAPVVARSDVPVRDLLERELKRRRSVGPTDYPGSSWRIEPAEWAARVRSLFVRAGPAVPQPLDTLLPVVLPRPVTKAERAARDSAERAAERADSIARAPVVFMRRPATPGLGGALLRLLADAYRTAVRADVALVSVADAGALLPSGPVTAAQLKAAVVTDHLISFRVTGEELETFLENAVREDTPCCEVSGIRVTYDAGRRPWDRLREVRTTAGREIDQRRSYSLVISSSLVSADSTFVLGRFGCREDKACQEVAKLSRWTVIRVPGAPVEILTDYLRLLPQPVALPDDRRLTPSR